MCTFVGLASRYTGFLEEFKRSKILTEEERLQNFCIEADALSGVSYFDAVNAGLEPIKYHHRWCHSNRYRCNLTFKCGNGQNFVVTSVALTQGTILKSICSSMPK